VSSRRRKTLRASAVLLTALGLAPLLLLAENSPLVTSTGAGGPGTWTQAQVNAATQKGVAYIDSQQNADGSFGSVDTPQIAETGMALVAYGVLANGSFSNLPATYQVHVKKAIAWLLGQQNPDGFWADFNFYQTYSTGIALAGLSDFQSLNIAIPKSINDGRAFLVGEFKGKVNTGCSSANGSPTAFFCGGWNYEDNTEQRSDESNTGFAMFGLRLTGGMPFALRPDNINWQHHIQEITTNPFASRNDGGGSYEPGINSGGFSSNANDTGTMLFGLAYDGVGGTDPHVVKGIVLGQDVLDEYELEKPTDNGVYHEGQNADGTCKINTDNCDWFFEGGEGGFHYSLFSLTKGLGEFIPPNLNDASNWYAKVVDMLLSQQDADGSWPQDGRDDGSPIIATAFSVSALGLVAVPTPTPTPTPTATPTPTPTPSPVRTPTPTPTPSGPGGMVRPMPPVSVSAGPGATVSSGTFMIENTSGTTLVAPAVTISFDNADLFSSATLTGTAPAMTTSTATLNPVSGGNSPEAPNNTTFVLRPALVIPTGETATFSLSVMLTNNPSVTRREGPVMVAAIIGGGTTASNAFLVVLALLELCAAGMSSTRRKRVLMALVLIAALASQVGCDNGSTSSGPGTSSSGVIQSKQTAMQVAAKKQANNDPVGVAGLPVFMGTVSLK
jgi:Prenyltransferase and squalene oxidase repeat